MDLLAAWLLFPLVLVAVSGGIGLLIERAAGVRLNGSLLVPLGFAGALVTSRMFTASPVSADFTLAALLVLAVLGGVLGRRRVRAAHVDWAPVLAAVGVFLVAGAPVIFTGSPTFSGSRALPDTSHQLALAAFLPEHGRDWESQELSSNRLNLEKYIVSAYPVASQATLGALSPLGLIDLAWLYQPYLSFVLALIPLSLYALLASAVRRRLDRGVVAFVAGQPALTVSFALQGSIKEITALSVIVLTAALAAASIEARWRARAFLVVAVSVVAAFGSLGPAAGAYVAPIVLVAAFGWAYRTLRSPSLAEVATALGVIVVGLTLLLPLLAGAETAYQANSAVLEMPEDLGNLAAALQPEQAAGVWLNGDYRYPVGSTTLNKLLLIVVIASALGGLGWSLRRRALAPLVLIVPLGLVSAYLLRRGSAYADAKVLAVAAPAVVTSAVLAAAYLRQDFGRVGRIAGVVLAAVIAGAVLASNAMTYHESQVAPYNRYSELLEIDHELEGKGPTLLTDYDEFSQYLLRDALPYTQPEWPHGYLPGALDDPARRPSLKTPIDTDHLRNLYLQSLPAIVTRRSPTVSRPPASFERTREGRYYEVWRPRRDRAFTVVEHLPLGASVFQPAAPAPCRAVRRMAAAARTLGGRLAYVRRPPLFRLTPAGLPAPPSWFAFGGYPQALVPTGAGEVDATVRLPRGRFDLWLEGEFGRRVSVRVGGRETGGVEYESGNPGQYFPVGRVDLAGGRKRVAMLQEGGDLRPGDGGGADSSLRHIGALVFSPPENERRAVRTVAPRSATRLCGRSLDWVEVVVPRAAGDGAS